jgi:hypothetical protein
MKVSRQTNIDLALSSHRSTVHTIVLLAPLRWEIGSKLEDADGRIRDSYLAETRAVLGDERFAAQIARGRALQMDEAIALALEESAGARRAFLDTSG